MPHPRSRSMLMIRNRCSTSCSVREEVGSSNTTTFALNETLHKKDIDEKLRSQFVGTVLLYIRDVLKSQGITIINDESRLKLRKYWKGLSAKQIRSGIEETLTDLLDGSDNKALKIELLQKENEALFKELKEGKK